eukprot:GFUD01013895.1.p1 GENE.GFUD01013895.1~~GFUD01013895.1.p1  ORF type:complete len:265 (-),score=66.07 GFUD01013895.1:335-1129(-)
MESITSNRQLDMEALKEPRGFLRCLQWFFAMLAFATCCDFSTKLAFDIVCKDNSQATTMVTTDITYPFSIDHNPPFKFGDSPPCGIKFGPKVKDQDITFPGDFSSDAQFFVFTGVITWLYCFASIAVYVFYSSNYSDEQKNYPKVDFVITALLAFFWLAGSSAWANGLNGIKQVSDPDNWIFTSQYETAAACFKTTNGTYVYTKIGECHTTSRGHFGGANVSVLFGFLNFFLWASNLWFLYKETGWSKAKQDQANLGNVETDPY